MKYLLKYAPEISIKSRPVRARFVRQLKKNLKKLLNRVNKQIQVEALWDYLDVSTEITGTSDLHELENVLTNTPGIYSVSRVKSFPLGDLDNILENVLDVTGNSIDGLTFAVRCKRTGKHIFSSVDVERYVGGGLNQRTNAAGVNLTSPEKTVSLEIRDDKLFVIEEVLPGLGGYPMGTQDDVLSLISGGFDSAVSSYLSMRRGLRTHYCFFNLGGREHEVAVKEVALYLWMKYGASHRVKFVTISFEEVVAEILENVENSQMAVILKRMMLRAASAAAEVLNIEALVTGESVAQVSSQTLPNLAVIDKVTDTLVLRPLIMSDKQEIVDIARAIGTEEFSASIPEYCGVISVKPTTRARMHKIEKQEAGFNFSVIDDAVKNMKIVPITGLQFHNEELPVQAEVVTGEPQENCIVIDIRHPDEQEMRPLVTTAAVEKIPFYKLKSVFEDNPPQQDRRYLLYCDKGMMSQLHAAYLLEEGYSNVGVYRPDK